MPVPILSVRQMRRWEAATWAAKRTPSQVISRVGHILTTRIQQLTQSGDFVGVLAGKGHNGDDARAAAQNLSDREVTLVNVFDPRAAVKEFRSLLALRPVVVLDGLFGIGLDRPLDPAWTRLVRAVNDSGVPVLSVDVPSGLNADTGQEEGAAIHATITLTLGAPKRGLLNATAWPFVGRLEVATDIGLVECRERGDLAWTLPSDFAGFPPPRPAHGHKGTFGHLAIVAGSVGCHGAAVLCTHAAQRAQPGLVTTFVEPAVYGPVAAHLRAAMVRPWAGTLGADSSHTAVVFGPGLAAPDLAREFRQALVDAWRSHAGPVIADASALDWLPRGAVRSRAPRVLTPHPGEAARLLGKTNDSIQSDRPGALRALSRAYGGAWVVLKGHQTLIGRTKGTIHVNPSGNPRLAQGGSGDVLAGYLGGLLAQPALAAEPEIALRFGVWQHGAAADELDRRRAGWTIEDLVTVMGSLRA